MEEAEKALREKVCINSKQKTFFKRKTNEQINSEYEENTFKNDLLKYQQHSIQDKIDIINKYTNPDKNTIYELSRALISQKKNDLDQFQTSLNMKLFEKMKEYLEIIELKNKVEEELKKSNNIKNDLNEQIKEINSTIENYQKETEEYTKQIEAKKKIEQDELYKLKEELDSIKKAKWKAENEKIKIQYELEEKMHILQKKDEELQKEKKNNLILSQEIKYYTEIINYQNQLHNDIQPYKNQMNNEYQEAKGNVRVFCRIRPPLQRELSQKQIDIEYRGENSLIIKGEKKASNIGREGSHQDIEQFQFNRIFRQNDTQEEVFEEVSPLIQSSLDGFNINIFAYGQTGSGKTYTMEGDTSSSERYGIIPRSVDEIFKYYEQELKNMGWEIKFFLSVCEIYNKKTRDLIGEKNVDKIEELKEMEIHNINEWNSNFAQIAQRRKVAETKMNMESSRSHLIFKIKIRLHNINGIEDDRFGSLNLIDLAGSERVDKSTVSEERFKESIEINSSLTHLKSVFEAMKSKNEKFIPFHNTPLTDALKDCLSGDNSKTLMFVNISPLLGSFKESTCSLKFATDVNKCYVSGNDEDSDNEYFDDIEKNYEPMDVVDF